MFSQWYLFNFPLLTFSFLSGGIHNFTPTPQRSERGRKRGRERESALKDWSLTNSLGYFDVTLTWFLSGYVFLGNLRDEIWKSLYFRLHYTMQHRMDILSVCGHFWMEELMWLPKMWDERERWKIESVSEWIRRREGETVRLTGECVLEEEWMTDICISFGMWNHWIFQFTFK